MPRLVALWWPVLTTVAQPQDPSLVGWRMVDRFAGFRYEVKGPHVVQSGFHTGRPDVRTLSLPRLFAFEQQQHHVHRQHLQEAQGACDDALDWLSRCSSPSQCRPCARITRRGFAHRGRSRASDETIVPVPGVRAAMTVSQRLRRDARVRRERCRVILAPRAPRASARPERRRRPASVLPGF